MQSNRFNKQRIARQDNLNAFANSPLGRAFGVVPKAAGVPELTENGVPLRPLGKSVLQVRDHGMFGKLGKREPATNLVFNEAATFEAEAFANANNSNTEKLSRIEEATKAMVDFGKIASQLGEQPQSHLQRSGTGRAGHKSAAEFFGRDEWTRKFDDIEKWLRTNGGEQTVYCNSRKVRGMLTASKQVKFYVDGQQVAKSKLLATLWPQASKQSGDAE